MVEKNVLRKKEKRNVRIKKIKRHLSLINLNIFIKASVLINILKLPRSQDKLFFYIAK